MDVEYLMKEIGEPLTEAMASLVDCRCHDAVEYIGYYLLNYVERENNMLEKQRKKANQLILSAEEEKKKAEEEEVQRIAMSRETDDFIEKIRQELFAAEHITPELMERVLEALKMMTGAENVYIAKKCLPPPLDPAEDEGDDDDEGGGGGGDGEEDEINPDENDLVEKEVEPEPDPKKDIIPRLEYLYATKGNEFMLDELLFEGEGVTFDLWKKKEGEEEEEEEEENEENEEGDENAPKKPKKEKQPELYVKEVLSEPRMRYFGIPKLGSYMALGFTYQSSLHPDAFVPPEPKEGEGEEEEDEDEDDKKKKGKKGKKGKKYESDSDDDDDEDKPKKEEPPPEPHTLPIDMVICFDSIGKDKEIDQSNNPKIHEWAQQIKRIYEQEEKDQFLEEYNENIKKDLKGASEDLETLKDAQKDAAKEIKNGMKALKRERHISDEEREMKAAQIRMDAAFSILSSFKSKIAEIRQYHISPKPKAVKVLLTCLYLLGYSKKKLMEDKRPNVADWNKMRPCFGDELFSKIENFNISEKKTIPKYATVKNLKRMIKKIDDEEINKISVAIGALLNWIRETLEAREKAIIVRKIEEKKQREEEERERLEREAEEAERLRQLAEEEEDGEGKEDDEE